MFNTATANDLTRGFGKILAMTHNVEVCSRKNNNNNRLTNKQTEIKRWHRMKAWEWSIILFLTGLKKSRREVTFRVAAVIDCVWRILMDSYYAAERRRVRCALSDCGRGKFNSPLFPPGQRRVWVTASWLMALAEGKGKSERDSFSQQVRTDSVYSYKEREGSGIRERTGLYAHSLL